MTTIRGSTAAITGAANGIGRSLAIELAARGCNLALADRDGATLQAIASEIAMLHSRKVTTHIFDVSDAQAIEAFAKEAISAHPALSILVNNAGVALMGTFAEIDLSQMEWLININFWGVVRGTRAFLPHLSLQREAHIVNLSSIFGIVAPPGQCSYAAAKFAVRGFSESLRHELQAAKSPVRLSVVHPGGIATHIARNSRIGSGMTDNERRAKSIERFEAAAKTTPRQAALRIIKGIEDDEPRILIGGDARMLDLLQRFRPATYWKVLSRRMEKAAAKARAGRSREVGFGHEHRSAPLPLAGRQSHMRIAQRVRCASDRRPFHRLVMPGLVPGIHVFVSA